MRGLLRWGNDSMAYSAAIKVKQPFAHRLHRHAKASFNNWSSLLLDTLRQRETMSDYLLAKTAADVAAWVAVANHPDSFRT